MKLISIKLATLYCAFALLISCNSKNQDQAVNTDAQTVTAEDTLPAQQEVQQDVNETETVSSNGECIATSTITLPYNKSINPDKATYKKLACKISGIEKFICDNTSQRYISFPDFENIKVILVPMDCGDFKYRYYLLTLFENKVVSDKYVEGEWYEPGSDDYKEITSFLIDADYVITIITKSVENGTTSIKQTEKISIRDDGTFDKVN